MCLITRWLEEEQIKLHASKNPPERVYIRFGMWEGRGRYRSLNASTHKLEKGLSVYNARLELDGSISLIADDPSMDLTAIDCAHLLSGRVAFPVTGKVSGTGSDGEPVLSAVRVLKNPIRLDPIPKEVRDKSLWQ
jgi:hypothetical protein